ncbi:MAG: discoidin domain-containing protein, partial [Clostridia bacterium]
IVSTEGYNADSVKVKVTVTVDDGEPEVTFVEKGSSLPNYAGLYPGATVKIDGDTNQPNVNVTVNTGAPAFESSIAIIGDKAVIYAVDEAIAATAVVAQYKDGELVDVKTAPVSVAANGTEDVAITPAEGATAIRVMVVESLESMKPVVRSTGAVLGSYSPAVLTVSDETQADQGFVGYAMFDGDTVNTRWTSQKYTEDDHCWAILDFGQEVSPSTVELYYNKYSERNSKFKLSVSTDGKSYTEVFNGQTNGTEAMSVSVEGQTFRYLKFEGFGNDNASDPKWTTINEIVIK